MGSKNHTLTEAQMPAHAHQTGIGGVGASSTYGAGPVGSETAQVVFDMNVGLWTAATGLGQAFPLTQASFVCRVAIRAR